MGKIRKYLLFIALISSIFVILGSFASAQSLESYDVKFSIAYGSAVVETEMVFNEQVSGSFAINLPEDAQGISFYLDDISYKAGIEKGRITAKLNSTKKIRIEYVTKELLDKSEFIVSLRMPYDAEALKVSLVLPEDAVLERPLPESDIDTSPAYPIPSKVTTDGRQIMLLWEYAGLKAGDEKSFFVKFREKTSYAWLILVMALIIVVLVSGLLYLYKRKPRVEKVVEKIVEKEDMLEKHLKEDEEQVVNILKQREGQCEQGTLRVITGFSKAKLSGLLKELEDRNVIYKEKRGKKNLVFLRKL